MSQLDSQTHGTSALRTRALLLVTAFLLCLVGLIGVGYWTENGLVQQARRESSAARMLSLYQELFAAAALRFTGTGEYCVANERSQTTVCPETVKTLDSALAGLFSAHADEVWAATDESDFRREIDGVARDERLRQLGLAVSAALHEAAPGGVLSVEDVQARQAVLQQPEIARQLGEFWDLLSQSISDELRELDRAEQAFAKRFEQGRRLSPWLALLLVCLALALSALLWSILRRWRSLTVDVEQRLDANELGGVPVTGPLELRRMIAATNRLFAELARSRVQAQALIRQERLRQESIRHELDSLESTRANLLADISHELRTPLTAIKGEAEISLRTLKDLSPEYRESMEQILSLAGKLSRIVDDLLELGRNETSPPRLRSEVIDVVPMVREAVRVAASLELSMHGEEARLSGVERIALNIRCAERAVRVDSGRLIQALVILLDNALRYSPAESTVDVCVYQARDMLRVAVRNQGKGISEDERALIFSRFYRSQDAKRRWPGGSGLGLAIAAAIVRAHGGTLELRSAPDGPTIFELGIPLDHSNESGIAANAHSSSRG
ncbi:MAG: hypothetical protein KDK91_28905 [Gammaproteobacteria bacterium]|nr:hypothetical protein [Gammaproteobacteria bacterium]